MNYSALFDYISAQTGAPINPLSILRLFGHDAALAFSKWQRGRVIALEETAVSRVVFW